MPQKDDWRLLNDVGNLKNSEINPTDGEEINKHAPYLNHCVFCLDAVQNSPCQQWYIPIDLSCCICEKCYNDFKASFKWKMLDGWDIEWRE